MSNHCLASGTGTRIPPGYTEGHAVGPQASVTLTFAIFGASLVRY